MTPHPADSEDFLLVVHNQKWLSTSDQLVDFDRLTGEEQDIVRGKWENLGEKNRERLVEKARQSKAKAETTRARRKNPLPKFKDHKQVLLDALEKDGWTVKRNLKTPWAKKVVNGVQARLEFRPRAIWLGVDGKATHSLVSDVRHLKPDDWIRSLPGSVARWRKLHDELNRMAAGRRQLRAARRILQGRVA